ncbi:MAG: hypothetical protein R3F11_01290 [Verrucomicrobiales bacterium]
MSAPSIPDSIIPHLPLAKKWSDYRLRRHDGGRPANPDELDEIRRVCDLIRDDFEDWFYQHLRTKGPFVEPQEY